MEVRVCDQGGNIGRFEEFLSRPSSTSVYAGDDELQTRGATWELLRYLADHTLSGFAWYRLALAACVAVWLLR